jgi:hypothetical protein
MKSVLAVLVGYLVFGVSAVLLFRIAGVDPHQQPGLGFRIGSIAYGILFALLAGYTAARIAGKNEIKHSAGVACILALLAGVSILAQPGLESYWSQLSALILMAPSAVFGGWLRKHQSEKSSLKQPE